MLDDAERVWAPGGSAHASASGAISRSPAPRRTAPAAPSRFERSGKSRGRRRRDLADGQPARARGIQMPFGCRMGICQSCVVGLVEGHVRDLRTRRGTRTGNAGCRPAFPRRPATARWTHDCLLAGNLRVRRLRYRRNGRRADKWLLPTYRRSPISPMRTSRTLGAELDAIRQDIEDSRGASDARCIRRTIAGSARAGDRARPPAPCRKLQAGLLVGGSVGPGRGQDHREHGDRRNVLPAGGIG